MATTPDTTFSLTIVRAIPKKPIHVADGIIEMKATLTKLEESGDNIVAALTLTAQNTHVDMLVNKQKGMSGSEDDRTEQRNAAYGLCFNDYSANEALVLIAALATGNLNDAIALVKRNGYAVKSKKLF